MFQLDIAFKLEHLQSSSSKYGKRLERQRADLSSKIPSSHATLSPVMLSYHSIVCHIIISHKKGCTDLGETEIAGLLWSWSKLEETAALPAVLCYLLLWKHFGFSVRPLPGGLWIVKTELGSMQNDGAGSDQGNVCSCLLPRPQSASHSLKSMRVFGKYNSGKFNNRHCRVMAAKAH